MGKNIVQRKLKLSLDLQSLERQVQQLVKKIAQYMKNAGTIDLKSDEFKSMSKDLDAAAKKALGLKKAAEGVNDESEKTDKNLKNQLSNITNLESALGRTKESMTKFSKQTKLSEKDLDEINKHVQDINATVTSAKFGSFGVDNAQLTKASASFTTIHKTLKKSGTLTKDMDRNLKQMANKTSTMGRALGNMAPSAKMQKFVEDFDKRKEEEGTVGAVAGTGGDVGAKAASAFNQAASGSATGVMSSMLAAIPFLGAGLVATLQAALLGDELFRSLKKAVYAGFAETSAMGFDKMAAIERDTFDEMTDNYVQAAKEWYIPATEIDEVLKGLAKSGVDWMRNIDTSAMTTQQYAVTMSQVQSQALADSGKFAAVYQTSASEMASRLAEYSKMMTRSFADVSASFNFITKAGHYAGIGLDTFEQIIKGATMSTFKYQNAIAGHSIVLARMAKSGIMTIQELMGMAQTQEKIRSEMGEKLVISMLRSGPGLDNNAVMDALNKQYESLSEAGARGDTASGANAKFLKSYMSAFEKGPVTPAVLQGLASFLSPEDMIKQFANMLSPGASQDYGSLSESEQQTFIDEMLKGMTMLGIGTGSADEQMELQKMLIATFSDTGANIVDEISAMAPEDQITSYAKSQAESLASIDLILQGELMNTLKNLGGGLNTVLEAVGMKLSDEKKAEREITRQYLIEKITQGDTEAAKLEEAGNYEAASAVADATNKLKDILSAFEMNYKATNKDLYSIAKENLVGTTFESKDDVKDFFESFSFLSALSSVDLVEKGAGGTEGFQATRNGLFGGPNEEYLHYLFGDSSADIFNDALDQLFGDGIKAPASTSTIPQPILGGDTYYINVLNGVE